MPTGTVIFTNPERGYGFIGQDTERQNLFFHCRACAGQVLPAKGARVEYSVETNAETGKPRAARVRVVDLAQADHGEPAAK